MKKKKVNDLSNKTKVTFEIRYDEKDKIKIINPSMNGEEIPIKLFGALIKRLVEVETWYNQTTQK